MQSRNTRTRFPFPFVGDGSDLVRKGARWIVRRARALADWINDEDVKISSATISASDCGAGRPAVIIIHGMAREKDEYRGVQKAIARYTRVLSYDRPGLGKSSKNSEPRTLDYLEQDLVELLEAKKIPPPFILLGHSMGGLFVRYFADRHPELVAGLVFVDTSHEDWLPYIRKTWSAQEQQHYFEFWDDNNPEYTGVKLEEKSAFEENCNLVRGLKIAKDMPVLVFSGGTPFRGRQGVQNIEADRRKWIELHASLLVGLKHERHIVNTDWNHWLHHQEPDYVASEIARFFLLENKEAR